MHIKGKLTFIELSVWRYYHLDTCIINMHMVFNFKMYQYYRFKFLAVVTTPIQLCGHFWMLNHFCVIENTKYIQWRNVISCRGPPVQNFRRPPLVEVPKARVERRICTSFLGGPGHVHPENFWIYTLWNAISWTLGRDFTEFWWSENDIVTYQRPPWPMFLLYTAWTWGPPFGPLGFGDPV